MTTTIETHAAAPSTVARRDRSRWHLVIPVTVALLLGVAAGRFVLYEPAPAGDPGTSVRREATTAEEAIARLEEAVERTPSDLASLVSLGGAYVRQATLTSDPSFYDLADRAFARADALAPDHEDTLIGRAALALGRHDFPLALALGTAVHDRNPTETDALVVMVDAEVELGRYDAAAVHLQQLLDLRPGLPAYARVSYLRELHGDLDGAVVTMREAEVAGSGAASDVAVVVTFIGDLELRRGDLDAAEAAYEHALGLAPDLPAAEFGRAYVWAARGDLDRAIGALKDLVGRVPLPAAATLLGDLQDLAGRKADAGRSFELVRTISRLRQASGQVTDLETALFEADHATDGNGAAVAVTAARAAYDARPDNVFAADALAWALFRSGDAAAARPLIDQALRLGTADALLRYHAAAVLAATGETERARAELASALDTNPWFSFRHRTDAAALAAELGVPVPAAWGAS